MRTWLVEPVGTLDVASWQADIRLIEAQIDIEWLARLKRNDRIRLPASKGLPDERVRMRNVR